MKAGVSTKALIVWVSCACFFLFELSMRTLIGTFEGPLLHDLHITSVQYTLLSTTVFATVYGLMQVPAGLILDHWGLKKSATLGALISGISTLAFAHVHHLGLALLARVGMGMGTSFAFLSMLVAVHDWMPAEYQGSWVGVSQWFATLGPMFVAGPLMSLMDRFGWTWRTIFSGYGCFALGLTVWVWCFVSNRERCSGEYIILRRPEPVVRSLKRLLVRWQPWAIALFCGAAYFSLEYLSENQGRSLLVVKGLTPQKASYAVTLAWLGYAIFCPLWGYLSDRWVKRRPFLILSASLGLLAMMGLAYPGTPGWLNSGCFFLIGIAAAGVSIGFVMITEQFKAAFVAVGLALNNTMVGVFTSLGSPLVTVFAPQNQAASIVAYHPMLLMLAGLMLLALTMSLRGIDETHAKSQVDFTLLKRS